MITPEQRNLDFLKGVVNKIWKFIVGAEKYAQELLPALWDPRYPNLPEQIIFMHAEEILDLYPNLPRKQRETAILERYPAIFIIGIGWMLKDGYPHELRAADYDGWITPTHPKKNGHLMRGLNGDIMVWNPVTRGRHELSSMGIRVNAESLKKQLELTHQLDFLKCPYHQAIVKHEIPLSIGGGIGLSRTLTPRTSAN